MESDQQNTKKSLPETILFYFTNTKPIVQLFHLFWLVVASCALSASYVLAFHFTSVVNIYREAHSITSFGQDVMVSARNDQRIETKLKEILDSTRANRAYIYRFHNGLAAVNGVPFFFHTMTHEVISPGTPRTMQFEQRIPASINLAMSNQFVRNRCAVIDNTERDPDSQNYWYFQQRGARSMVRCPIFMQNGDLFGFIGVDYLNDLDRSTLESVAARLREQSIEMGSIFMTMRRR